MWRGETARREAPLVLGRSRKLALHSQQVKVEPRALRGNKQFPITACPQRCAAPYDLGLPLQDVHHFRQERRLLFERYAEGVDAAGRYHLVSVDGLVD